MTDEPRASRLALVASEAKGGRVRGSVSSPANTFSKRDAIVVAVFVALSITAQALAALYLESTGSLLALGGSALVFMVWVFLRFGRAGHRR